MHWKVVLLLPPPPSLPSSPLHLQDLLGAAGVPPECMVWMLEARARAERQLDASEFPLPYPFQAAGWASLLAPPCPSPTTFMFLFSLSLWPVGPWPLVTAWLFVVTPLARV